MHHLIREGKTLANGLKIVDFYTKEEIEQAIADCGFSPTIRGEALRLEDFAQLANRLS